MRNDLLAMSEKQNKKRLGIYIHIPFCKSKCAYCDFYSGNFSAADREEYLFCLVEHIKRLAPTADDYAVDSIFLGGGTPTVIGGEGIARIGEALSIAFHLSRDTEFSVEANPGTVERADLGTMKRAGVNRISFGLQSSHDSELKALSRIHSYSEFLSAYSDARNAGFDNINIDLMYGLPDQTVDSFAETVERVSALSPEHLSLYGLKIEDGTPFGRMRDRLVLPDEDSEYEMYLMAADLLGAAGYRHYEISNYAKPGQECRHNLKYWDALEYIGFGPSAYSYFGGRRYGYIGDLTEYIAAVKAGCEPIEYSEEITEKDREAEYIMLRLRLRDGITRGDFYDRFGIDFAEKYREKLSKYISLGIMENDRDRYYLGDRGMYVSNTVISDIAEFDV